MSWVAQNIVELVIDALICLTITVSGLIIVLELKITSINFFGGIVESFFAYFSPLEKNKFLIIT